MAKPKTLIVTCDVPANTPANVSVPANIIEDGRTKVEIVVPKGKKLKILDIYITDTGEVGVDSEAVIKIDGTEVARTGPLKTKLASNPSRPRIGVIEVDEQRRLTIDVFTLASVGTGGASVKFYMDVVYEPKGFKLEIPKLF